MLKNALDWVIGSGEFMEKPVALVNASPMATHAQASLKETLTVMTARVVADARDVEQALAALKISAPQITNEAGLRDFGSGFAGVRCQRRSGLPRIGSPGNPNYRRDALTEQRYSYLTTDRTKGKSAEVTRTEPLAGAPYEPRWSDWCIAMQSTRRHPRRCAPNHRYRRIPPAAAVCELV